MRLSLVCPRTGAFIRVAVVQMAARDRTTKKNVVRPFVGVVPYDPPGRKVWSDRDVERCERNQRFFHTEAEAKVFARDIARTLQQATSLGRLTLLSGEHEQAWHDAKFCVR